MKAMFSKMLTGILFEAEGTQSAVTSQEPKPSAAKPSKHASTSRNPDGRPGQFPDKTMLRMPKGWLKALNAKARKAGLSQSAFLRKTMARPLGKTWGGC